MTSTPGQFGRYEVIRLLGAGGMADVYLGRDTELDRLVAVKVLRREQLGPISLARFRFEAQAVAAMTHSAIVPLYDFGEVDGQPYLVMRYMPGGTLADRLDGGPLALEAALLIIERIAAALDYAHGRGVIHRDVKPGNILFDEDGLAYLTDFGIARGLQSDTETTQARLTKSGFVLGTPTYISPEQVRGIDAISAASDIYSLGVVIFEMLAGRAPYNNPSSTLLAAQHVTEPIPSIRAIRPDLPEGLQAVIERAMAKEAADRYSNCAALVADLRLIAAEPLALAVAEGAVSASGEHVRPTHEAAPTGPRPSVATWTLGYGARIRKLGVPLLVVWQMSRQLARGGDTGAHAADYKRIRRRAIWGFVLWAALVGASLVVWRWGRLDDITPALKARSLFEAYDDGRWVSVSVRLLAERGAVLAVAFLLLVMGACRLLSRMAKEIPYPDQQAAPVPGRNEPDRQREARALWACAAISGGAVVLLSLLAGRGMWYWPSNERAYQAILLLVALWLLGTLCLWFMTAEQRDRDLTGRPTVDA